MGDHYYLHPEFVNEDKTAYLRKNCCNAIFDNNKKHNFMIKDGCDFGGASRIGLRKLTPLERSSSVVVRLCHVSCKLSAACGPSRGSMKGHAVSFRHDASMKCASLFHSSLGNDQLQNVLKEIWLWFAEPNNEVDKLSTKRVESRSLIFRARGHVICQWLAVLQKTSTKHENTTLPTVAEIDDFSRKLQEVLA